MQNRRPTLLAALLVSLLIHAFIVGSREFSLTDFFAPEDEVLESHQPVHVQRVRLATRPPPPAQAKSLQENEQKDVPATATANTVKKQPAAASLPENSDAEPQDSLSTEDPVKEVAPTQAPVALPTQPAPAFPVQLEAELDASFNDLPVVLTQTWYMEGNRYAIRLNGSKFGFVAQLDSEGRIHPAGGLNPEASQMALAGKVRSVTRYSRGVIQYGKPDSLREAPLPVIPQDLASLPFHLAVTFDGRPQSIFVSTGRSVYQVRFSLEAEEKLRLPAGTLRTLHLVGEFFHPDLGEMVRAFDIWLAPDYLNFPVKVSGHLRGGDPIEYRVTALEMEGRMVFGTKRGNTPAPSGEAIPEWLQARLRSQGLNNPR
jgi:hypothetical protein